jgi:hypothetical protein
MANVVGSFARNQTAVDAVAALSAACFSSTDIGLLSRDQGWTDQMKQDPSGTKAEQGAGLGAAAGAITGTGLGLAVAAGLLPPLGPAVVGGTLVALLASAASGATAGTIIGGLVGLGVPEDEAAFYVDEYCAGRAIVTVAAGDPRAVDAERILRSHGARIRPRPTRSVR